MVHSDAFILIGGRSSRLGTDKALVELGGMTLAERAVNVIRNALPESGVTMVAGSSKQFAIEAITIDVPFIFDLHEGRGPLGGLHAALSYARTPWIFVLACDYPFVSAKLIGSMAERMSDEFQVIVPRQSDGRLQPLCAFYNVKSVRPVVEEILLLQRPSPPLHEIITRLKPLVISLDESSADPRQVDPFININDAQDLERAKKVGRGLFESSPGEP